MGLSMAMTRRARRRIMLLVVCIAVLSGFVTAAWYFRNAQKANEARVDRIEGLDDARAGRWPEALQKLSKAVAFNKDDLEALITLADARSRVSEANNRHFISAMKL